jgi:hypothetical protein
MESFRRSTGMCDLERVRQVRPKLNAELDEEEDDE